MSCSNKFSCSTNPNFGVSTRLGYDESTFRDRTQESVSPLEYRLNTNQSFNCNSCLSTLGPRSGPRGYCASSPLKYKTPAPAQEPEVVNIESILTNRNVYTSKNRRNEINPLNPTKFYTPNPRICNSTLNPVSSRLTLPPASYREIAINRFYDLNKNPQANIFWDGAVNSTLQAKDNYVEEVPDIWSPYVSEPHEDKEKPSCRTVKQCPFVQY